MSAWVDYRKLRETLNFQAVLDYYRVQYKRKGTQATAFCPLPTHEGHQNSPAFSVSFVKGIWQCFGCGATGNILDFITRMEGLDPRNATEFRRAALLAQERFGGGTQAQVPRNTSVPPARSPDRQPASPKRQLPTPQQNPQVLVNEPLNFELKNLDTKPRYLLDRGFTERTIAHFGLGYCSKGLFAGRIVIPLHNAPGRLIGYAGRLVFDETVDEENPKYLFPAKRERNGKILEFAKSLFVYNGHNLKPPLHDLIIVQGFTSIWWLWQHGHEDVVALMGSSCSVDQARAIVDLVSPSGRVWFMTDAGQDAGRCAQSIFSEIGPHRFCKWVKLLQGQPTDCSAENLNSMLEWKIHF